MAWLPTSLLSSVYEGVQRVVCCQPLADSATDASAGDAGQSQIGGNQIDPGGIPRAASELQFR